MQQLMSPSLRSVVGTTKASHMPQSTLHVFDQTDQYTSHEAWSSGSHINMSTIICRLKNSFCSSIIAVTLELPTLAQG